MSRPFRWQRPRPSDLVRITPRGIAYLERRDRERLLAIRETLRRGATVINDATSKLNHAAELAQPTNDQGDR